MFDQIIGYVKKLTEAGVALLALGIIMQVIFGDVVPFVGGDIVGNITAIVASLGEQGLVGLVALGVIYAIWQSVFKKISFIFGAVVKKS